MENLQQRRAVWEDVELISEAQQKLVHQVAKAWYPHVLCLVLYTGTCAMDFLFLYFSKTVHRHMLLMF